jgi:hypothetical protein
MTEYHLKIGLLAALLHDIGQYPMAHDLAEVASGFAHERFSRNLLELRGPQGEPPLAAVLKREWGIELEDLLHALEPNESTPIRYRILNSLVSGPLDCDKLDYLKRDGTHLGVKFAASIDRDRLLRHLTVVYGHDPSAPARYVAELGVAEKARAVAQTVIGVRQEMFRQVYWHHTVRALKAMLSYVVRSTLIRLRTKDDEESFWTALGAFVTEGRLPPRKPATEPTDGETGEVPEWLEDGSDLRNPLNVVGGLGHTDADVLALLSAFAQGEAARVLNAVLTRKVYRRIAVMSHSRERAIYEGLYGAFSTYRHDGKLGDIEEQRRRCQQGILAMLAEKLGVTAARELETRMVDDEPIVLLDIPLKALKRQWEKRPLWFVPEDSSGVHGRTVGSIPILGGADADVEGQEFDKEVGKIRVFAHPEWHDLIAKNLSDADILQVFRS